MGIKARIKKLADLLLSSEEAHQSKLIEAHRHQILKSTVLFTLWTVSGLTLLWSILDYFAFSIDIWGTLMKVRFVTVALMIALTLYISEKGYSKNFIYFLFILPLMFFGLSYNILNSDTYTGVGQIAFIIYENIPFVIMAAIGLMPLSLHRALGVFILVLTGTYLAYTYDPDHNFPIQLLARFWVLFIIGGMGIIISRIQFGLLSSLVNKNITDPLTGALNRSAGQLILDLNIAAAKRGQESVAIAFLDIDHFKSVNDDFGHEAGDEVLKNFAKTILARKRDTDAFVRWGGEEFILILTEIDKIDPQKAIERVLGDDIGTRPDGTPLTISGGVVDWMKSGATDCAEFVQMADQMMYKAKEEGRNRIIGYWDEQI